MNSVYTFGRYLKKRYRTKVCKIPISISGFTCPNIDGTSSRGGCTFCQNDSFSPNLKNPQIPKKRLSFSNSSISTEDEDRYIDELISQYISYSSELKKRVGAKKFIIYFQSFTNTYAPYRFLEKLYLKALSLNDVIGISVGTRSDCVEDSTLELLSKLSLKHEIWIEYGVQSIHNETLEEINRGHDIKNLVDTINRSRDRGIKICAHLIYGLPGESMEMMKKSTDFVLNLGIDAIKLHPLYVVNKSLLALKYQKEQFKPISIDEYIDMVVYAIKSAPKEMIFQRVSAGTSKDLIAPKWCENKNYQMDRIKKALLENGFRY